MQSIEKIFTGNYLSLFGLKTDKHRASEWHYFMGLLARMKMKLTLTPHGAASAKDTPNVAQFISTHG